MPNKMLATNFECPPEIATISKPLILVEKDEQGNFREITEIRIETKNEIEALKENVEKRKIEIKVLLPRIFRDAVTMEQVHNGMVVFTVPESVARQFSLVQ